MDICHISKLIMIVYALMQSIAIADSEPQYMYDHTMYMLMLSLLHFVVYVLYVYGSMALMLYIINDELN